MAGLIVLGVIVGIIALIMLIPVGADVGYENGELSVSAKVCGVMLKLLPKEEPGEGAEKKPKKEKKKKPKKKKEKPPEPEGEEKPKKKKKLNLNADELFGLVKAAFRGLGKFGRVRVDRFLLHYTAGGDDPYSTAMTYNYVNAALSSLGPICREKFIVKQSDVWTDVDFTLDKMKIDFGICLVIRIGQVFRMAFAVLFGILGILIKNKFRLLREGIAAKREARRERRQAAAEGREEENTENTETENIQDDERKVSNG